MHFEDTSYITTASLLTLLLIIFFMAVLRWRRVRIERFADKDLVAKIAPPAALTRKIFKMCLVVCAVFLSLISLSRPQWGFEYQEVKRSGLDILIAMDVSKSMLATDMKPNRLERSKYAVKDLIQKLSGDRVGLIAFAGTSFLQCPLTIDYNGLMLSLDDLSTATIPRGGTSIESAIREAMNIFKGPEKKFKALVIITDGEEFEGDSLKAAQQAAETGMKIYCVGVGTLEGELIPYSQQEAGARYLSDRGGNIVKTKLNEDILKRIALSTGGSYVHATQKDFGLVMLYDRGISKLEKRDMEVKARKRYTERYQIFLAIAALMLCIEPFIGDSKRKRDESIVG